MHWIIQLPIDGEGLGNKKKLAGSQKDRCWERSSQLFSRFAFFRLSMSRPWKRSATIIQSSTLMAEASITGGLIHKVLNLVHEYDYLVTSSLVGWGGSTENGSIFGQVSEVYAKVTKHLSLISFVVS